MDPGSQIGAPGAAFDRKKIAPQSGAFGKAQGSPAVVIGHRRKGGVSKARICEILALDPSPFLDDLLRQELVYADPARELNFWRPTPSALLALGLRSFSDIPALKELEDWFDSLATQSAAGASPAGSELDSYFARTRNLHSRRLKRDSKRQQSVARVDVTEEFPFLHTKLSPYYDR
jgi:hypothetical protein